MADTRKDRRAPAALRVKYKSATVDQFIEQSGVDISQGGIFVKTKKPLKIGALLKFEFQLSDASSVMSGVGRVAWRRQADTADAAHPPGMGLKFLKLEGDTESLVERIVRERTDGGSRYDDAKGAEVAEGAFSLPPPAPAVEPPAPAVEPPAPASEPPAPASSGSGPRPSPGSGSGPRPASVPSPPPPVAPGGVAGLFGASKAPLPPAATSPSGSSFFGAQKPADDQVRDASEFLASAFSEASEDTAAAARQQADEAKRVSERPPPVASGPSDAVLPDDLWDDDDEALPGSAASAPPPAAASVPPAASPSIDPFTDSDDAGRVSEPAFGSDAPADAMDVAISEPPMTGAEAEADPFGSLADAPDGEFGEVDLANSIPPAADGAPVTTLSDAPPGFESEPPVGAVAAPAAAAEKKSSGGLIAAVVVVLLAAGGGGFWFMNQGKQAPPPTTAKPAQPTAPTAPVADPADDGVEGEAGEADGPAVEATGERVALQVTSRPRTSEVLVRGEKRGEAPLKLMLPQGEPVFITVRAEGFTPLRRKVTPGKAPTAHFELKPMQYEVVVASEPTGAEVSVEGGASITTPGILKIGPLDSDISISAQKEGFRRTSRPVRIDEFKLDGDVMRASLSISLSALPGGASAQGSAAPAPAPKKRKRRRKKAAAPEPEKPEALPDNPF